MKYKRILALVLAAVMALSFAACGAESQPEETTPTGKEVTLGQLQDGTYTNTYAGFACTLAEGWEYECAEQTQDLPEYVTDLKADNGIDLTSLLVKYQKHTTESMVSFMAMTEEQVVESVLKSKTSMIAAYEKEGMEVVTLEKTTVQFAGAEHFAVHMEANIQGVPYYTTTLYFYGIGQYGMTLVAGSFLADNTDELLGLFTAA